MLEAVLFDWGGTLMSFEWDDELLVAGHRAGLAAIGREDATLTDRWRREVEPRLPGRPDYRELMRALLGGPDDEELEAFEDAEHDAWAPAHELAATTHALLEALRRRGLRLAVVGNPWPEDGRLVRRDLERLGVAERIDVAVFAEEPVREALRGLRVAPELAAFVGDGLRDLDAAARLGLTTIQALWFRADDADLGVEPDVRAFTQMDVLNAVDRLLAA